MPRTWRRRSCGSVRERDAQRPTWSVEIGLAAARGRRFDLDIAKLHFAGMSGSVFQRLYPVLAGASAVALSAGPAAAADPGLVDGFAAAMRGCEKWVLDPDSWLDGPEKFVASMTGGVTVSRPQMIPEAAEPPAGLRRGNQSWRVSGAGHAGYFLTTSEELPMCHIVGDAQGDYGSSVAAVLATPRFVSRWEPTGERSTGGRIVATFRNRSAPNLELTVTRPATDSPGRGSEVTATARVRPET